MVRFRKRPRRSARIEMIPLIDIVFLLLVVFIYAMLSMAVHKGLRVELPDASTGETDRSDYFSVTLARDGTVYVDLEPVTLEELTRRVAAESERAGRELHVQLNAQKDVPLERVVQVLDRIRAGGVRSLSIMTRDTGS